MAKKQVKKEDGRKDNSAPSKLTDENRVKLKEVAALDGTVEEMAYFCNVSKQTIYNWFKEEPDLFDEVERLRNRPILKARQTVNKRMEESYQNAMDYLKRKKKLEFGDNMDMNHKGQLIIQVTGESAQRYGLNSTPDPETSSD